MGHAQRRAVFLGSDPGSTSELHCHGPSFPSSPGSHAPASPPFPGSGDGSSVPGPPQEEPWGQARGLSASREHADGSSLCVSVRVCV